MEEIVGAVFEFVIEAAIDVAEYFHEKRKNRAAWIISGLAVTIFYTAIIAACVVVCITSTSIVMTVSMIVVIALLLWGIRRVWVHKEEKQDT